MPQRAQRLVLPVIEPLCPAPAQRDQVQEHARGVAQEVDCGGGVIIPADRNFHNPAAVALDEEEDFRVVAEAGGAQELEGATRGARAEELEAALRVVDCQAGGGSDGEVKEASVLLGGP